MPRAVSNCWRCLAGVVALCAVAVHAQERGDGLARYNPDHRPRLGPGVQLRDADVLRYAVNRFDRRFGKTTGYMYTSEISAFFGDNGACVLGPQGIVTTPNHDAQGLMLPSHQEPPPRAFVKGWWEVADPAPVEHEANVFGATGLLRLYDVSNDIVVPRVPAIKEQLDRRYRAMLARYGAYLRKEGDHFSINRCGASAGMVVTKTMYGRDFVKGFRMMGGHGTEIEHHDTMPHIHYVPREQPGQIDDVGGALLLGSFVRGRGGVSGEVELALTWFELPPPGWAIITSGGVLHSEDMRGLIDVAYGYATTNPNDGAPTSNTVIIGDKMGRHISVRQAPVDLAHDVP